MGLKVVQLKQQTIQRAELGTRQVSPIQKLVEPSAPIFSRQNRAARVSEDVGDLFAFQALPKNLRSGFRHHGHSRFPVVRCLGGNERAMKEVDKQTGHHPSLDDGPFRSLAERYIIRCSRVLQLLVRSRCVQ